MSERDPSPGEDAAARDDERDDDATARDDDQRGDDDQPRTAGERTRTDDRSQSTDDTGSSDTLFNAVVGAVVTAITAFFVPFSPVLGGGVAGYLEGGETDDGLRVGALSGVFAMVPLLLVFLLALFVLPILAPPRGAIGLVIVALFVVLFGAIYTVGLSALGGAVGIYAKNEL